ncbi:MAG: PfkB family carbohydrate kinase [Thermodesulfobacteriota bacterium]
MAAGGLPPLIAAGRRPWDVLCLGNNAADSLCLVPHFPERGSKLRMTRFLATGGGQAATAACALARLGHRVAYAGAVGDDPAGELAASRLREAGVDPCGLVVRPGATSQQAFIMVEEGGGERTIIWTRDPACHLDPAELDPNLVTSCRTLHLDGHFIEVNLTAARLARDSGALVCLDGERIQEGTLELVRLCHVVVGERSFPQRLTGVADPQESLRALADLGPAWAGRTLGHQGAEMLVDGQLYCHPGFVVQVVDSTGAGDVFHAGLLHAILLGQTPAQALATANALAAISTTALGGRSALADRAGLEAFLAARGSQAG